MNFLKSECNHLRGMDGEAGYTSVILQNRNYHLRRWPPIALYLQHKRIPKWSRFHEYDGSDSEARPNEAVVSWRKISDNAKPVKVSITEKSTL